jgi:mono/diheme cytochrome c family protein
MSRLIVAALLAAVLSGGSVFAGEGDFIQYQQILDSKCSQCHPRGRIEQAIERGVNFAAVIEKMIRLGAELSAQEKQVLGVFWRSEKNLPAPKKQVAATVAEDPLGEFRAVLASRCTGCHSLERVEAAMAQGRSLDDLVEMMRKRGAIITEADKNALDPFWGSPYKEK